MIEFSCELPRHSFSLNLTMQVESGSVYSLFGPSAAGKSSALHVMAGFENKVSSAYLAVNGRVLLDVRKGKRLNTPAWRRGIVLVEQGALLFPHLTVGQNIYYGIRTNKDPWLNEWVERFGLGPYLHARADHLSGGLTQRAVLVRAIAGRPEILLLDEAFSALDWSLRRVLQDAILDLRQELGTTVIMVTHQLVEAQRMADIMGIINHGQILQEGAPEHLMMSPKSWDVAKLLGYTHLLTDKDGRKFAFHPHRVIPGEQPKLGPILLGTVKNTFLHEAERRVIVELHSPESPVIEFTIPIGLEVDLGKSLACTLINPPYVE